MHPIIVIFINSTACFCCFEKKNEEIFKLNFIFYLPTRQPSSFFNVNRVVSLLNVQNLFQCWVVLCSTRSHLHGKQRCLRWGCGRWLKAWKWNWLLRLLFPGKVNGDVTWMHKQPVSFLQNNNISFYGPEKKLCCFALKLTKFIRLLTWTVFVLNLSKDEFSCFGVWCIWDWFCGKQRAAAGPESCCVFCA